MRAIVTLAVLIGGGFSSHTFAEDPMTVADGRKVTLEYTLALPDRTVIESNVGREPVTYIHGNHQIIRGLEKGLIGMKPGDNKHITVEPEEAYGQYDEKKKVAVPKDKIPPEAKVGTRLRSPDGQEARVVAIDGNSVVVDTNHPLAGKALVFDINILKVEKESKASQ
jgi:FKBP-type peptidyl-prolyl cis-trans isomerase 2